MNSSKTKIFARTTSVLLIFILFLQTPIFGQTELQPVNQELFNAVYALNLEKVKQALDNGADPNATDKHGRPPLIIASGNDYDLMVEARASEDIVRLLLSKGANPNIRIPGNPIGIGATPLLGALMFNKYSIAQLLLDKGADPKLPDERGTTPLCMAARTQEIKLINLLLEHGADPNQKGDASCSSLSLCMERDRTESDHENVKSCLIRLLDAKADPNFVASTATPLMTAASFAKPEILQLLLARGARVNAETEGGRVALDYATIDNKQLLLRNGADVNHRDKDGVTPLMRAMTAEDVELLLRNGARLNDADNEGLTAVAHAVLAINVSLINSILAHHPTLNLNTKSGETLLHLVFRDTSSDLRTDSDFLDTIGALIKAGVSINRKNVKGDTPIHLAAGFGSPSVIQLLARNGANLFATDQAGKTPLDRAAAAANEEASLLLQDLTSRKPQPIAKGLPQSFWIQFSVSTVNTLPVPVSSDPDPMRRALLQDLAYDLLKLGFSDSDGNLRSFWQKIPETERKRLLREHAKAFSSYDPLRSFFPDRSFKFGAEAGDEARTLLARYYESTKQSSDPDSALKALNLNDGPLTAVSLAHLASAIPKSLGTKPAVMKQAALHSLLFGTFLHLYPDTASEDKEVNYDEARKYFNERIRIIGADLMKLYRAQRPLLQTTFNRPMRPLDIEFQLSRSRTYASLDTSQAKPKRYASISYNDVVDSFHASVADGLAPVIKSDESDFDDVDGEEYLAAFWSTLPKEMEMFGKVSDSTKGESESEPRSRAEVIKNVQSIQQQLSAAQPLDLNNLAAQGRLQKLFADLLINLGRSRPQKKDMPVFFKPFSKRLETLKAYYEKHQQEGEKESEAIFRWFAKYAVNAFLYDASRKVETQFNNVIQFALAHEIGHHVFGTAEIHDAQAEDDADAFAVTLLTGAYVHLSLTDLTVLNQRNEKTGTKLVVLDGAKLREYIGYPIYFGSRLREGGNHTPLSSDHRSPDERVKFLTDRFRSVYRVLQNRIFADRIKTYRRRQVSRDVLDEFTSVVTVVSGGR